jgi:hypothetical protein
MRATKKIEEDRDIDRCDFEAKDLIALQNLLALSNRALAEELMVGERTVERWRKGKPMARHTARAIELVTIRILMEMVRQAEHDRR